MILTFLSGKSSGSHHSTNSAGWKTSLSNKCTNGPQPAPSEQTSNGFKTQTTTVMPALTNGKLKSSLSKSSLLKQPSHFNFENHQNIQQIVKQKRENCQQVNRIIPR